MSDKNWNITDVYAFPCQALYQYFYTFFNSLSRFYLT